ncbi:MAG: FHA domain-containing protein [Pseudomonadota bacterium]
MGALQRRRDGQIFYLRYQLVIGRSSSSDLALPVSSVSTQQAVIRWDNAGWVVSDLSSRNGTYVNGRRLAPGTVNSQLLERGDELAFAERDEIWTLIDDAAPQPLLAPEDGTAPFPLNEGVLSVLPSEEAALGYVYFERGSWRFEDGSGGMHDLADGQTILIGNSRYRLHLPGVASETPAAANPILERLLSSAELEISVSADEESAAITAIVAGERFDLQARTHLYLLAYLARQRLRAPTIADGGWVAVEEACRQLDLSPELLAVTVFRCRKEFEHLAFVEATRIVDRARRGLLRIGVTPERLRVKST